MSEHLHYFAQPAGVLALALPFPIEEVLGDWDGLRRQMIREVPAAFTRDEWAYLISFLERHQLAGVYEQTFGCSTFESPPGGCYALARPRGPVAIWLPNNVSLLGPLTLILMSLSGNWLRLKGGSHGNDMTGAFLEFARRHLPEGALKTHLALRVRHEVFERGDPRHAQMVAESALRIVFGTDAAAAALHALPHPLESQGFSFVDRRSEAWLELNAVNDGTIANLLRVFAIYGQAGCTSPRRVVLLDASLAEAEAFRDHLVEAWPRVIRNLPPPHVASTNIMTRQWAAALGWNARLTDGQGAVMAVAPRGIPEFESVMGLMIVPATGAEAESDLPANIQTIGYAFTKPRDTKWVQLLARTRIRRWVPLIAMHHFGPVWDGQPFWRQAFEIVDLQG